MPRPLNPALLTAAVLAVLMAAVLVMARVIGDNAESGPEPPRAVIERQLALLRGGDLDGVRATLTPRLRESVAQADVTKAGRDLAHTTVDELVGSEHEVPGSAPRRIELKMPSGRPLTTLVETDGIWLADTVWFR